MKDDEQFPGQKKKYRPPQVYELGEDLAPTAVTMSLSELIQIFPALKHASEHVQQQVLDLINMFPALVPHH